MAEDARIYAKIGQHDLKSEAIHETGLSGNVVTSFFPLIIFIYIYIYNEYFQTNMGIMISGKQSAIWVLSICVAIENE